MGKKIHVFFGSMEFCGSAEPHYPHVTGTYDTVRYGQLERYCPGVPGAGVEYRIVGHLSGTPGFPGVLRWVEGSQFIDPGRMYLGERQDGAVHDEIVAEVMTRIRVRELDERLLRIIRERRRGSSGAE